MVECLEGTPHFFSLCRNRGFLLGAWLVAVDAPNQQSHMNWDYFPTDSNQGVHRQ